MTQHMQRRPLQDTDPSVVSSADHVKARGTETVWAHALSMVREPGSDQGSLLEVTSWAQAWSNLKRGCSHCGLNTDQWCDHGELCITVAYPAMAPRRILS